MSVIKCARYTGRVCILDGATSIYVKVMHQDSFYRYTLIGDHYYLLYLLLIYTYLIYMQNTLPPLLLHQPQRWHQVSFQIRMI